MFSKTCEYAIRALIYLSKSSDIVQKKGVKEIADAIDAPEYFIGKIMQILVKERFVNSVKGPRGGFYLEPELLKRNLADIVIAIDGERIFYGCGLGLNKCNAANPCPIHFEFSTIRKELYQVLSNTELRKFVDSDVNQAYFLKSIIN